MGNPDGVKSSLGKGSFFCPLRLRVGLFGREDRYSKKTNKWGMKVLIENSVILRDISFTSDWSDSGFANTLSRPPRFLAKFTDSIPASMEDLRMVSSRYWLTLNSSFRSSTALFMSLRTLSAMENLQDQ